MNLHDPQRPTIAHKKAFLGGMVVIPQVNIWPKEKVGYFDISLMLPLKEASGIISKWFTVEICVDDIANWLLDFYDDPEKTIMETFSKGEFTPNLEAKQNQEKENPKENPADLLDDL